MSAHHVCRADVSGQRQRGRSRRGLPCISPTRAWLASTGANFPHDGTRIPPLGARVASSRGRTFVGAPSPRGTPRSRRAYWSFQWTPWTLVDTLRERAWAVHWGKLTFFHMWEVRRHNFFFDFKSESTFRLLHKKCNFFVARIKNENKKSSLRLIIFVYLWASYTYL